LAAALAALGEKYGALPFFFFAKYVKYIKKHQVGSAGMFKEDREESQFTWSMLGDIEAGRPNLGPMMHLAVYRLMQFTLRDVLIRDFGVETADRLFFEAGKKAGEEFCRHLLPEASDMNSFVAGVQQAMKDLGMAIFRVESAEYDKGSFTITLA
jgi:uncharacterized protein